jgi:hypothetical protein
MNYSNNRRKQLKFKPALENIIHLNGEFVSKGLKAKTDIKQK